MVAKRMDDSVRRRVRAGRLLLAGKTPAQAAQAVGVARQTAYTWKAVLDNGGIDALRAMPPRGARRVWTASSCVPSDARWCNARRRTASPRSFGRSSGWACSLSACTG